MTRPPIAKPNLKPIAEAVIVEASETPARASGGGRVLAQLEHNAMLALGLTRAAHAALHALSEPLDRAAELAERAQTFVDPTSARELRSSFDAVKERVENAAHAGHTLLQGGAVSFALDDPWIEPSDRLYVELPDLGPSVLGPDGLCAIELTPRAGGLISLRIGAVRHAIARGHGNLERATHQLDVVVLRLNASRSKSTPPPKLLEEEFADFTGRVRDHVLRSGASALRVQGTPSTKAASLIEGVD
jgi:hypothetical protein